MLPPRWKNSFPRHPLDKYHQSQLEFLAALPEAQRAYHAQLFRLGNASYRYQQQAAGEVTEEDFPHWLAGLPEKMRLAMERDGFEASRHSWPLRRHTLERRDLGHDAFLQAILSLEDWAYQQELTQSPPPSSSASKGRKSSGRRPALGGLLAFAGKSFKLRTFVLNL